VLDKETQRLKITFVEGKTTAKQVAEAVNHDVPELQAELPPGSTGDGKVTAQDDATLSIRAPRGDTPPGEIGLSFLGLHDSGYLLPFEIISVHLLVVLIGAAYLARTKRRAAETT
jgi:hypothetical protein